MGLCVKASFGRSLIAAAGNLALRPSLVPILGPQGKLTAQAASETGLPAGAMVTYRAGDQPNNAFSLGVFQPGVLATVAGTSGVLYGIATEPVRDPQNRVNTFVHVTDSADQPRLGVLMCINGAGSSYSWLRRLAPEISFEDLNQAAEQAPAGSEGIIVLPFGNGAERILENRVLGSSIHQLDFTRHGLPHVARATLEGVAFTMAYGLKIMQGVGVTASTIRVGDASLFRSPLFSQIFAALTGAVLEVYNTDGSLGAARAAGLGAGNFGSPDESMLGLEVVRTVEPNRALADQYCDPGALWNACLQKVLTNP